MKYFKRFLLVIFILFIFLIIFIFTTHGKEHEFDPGPEFAYKALENVKNVNYAKHKEYITLTDGTKIAITYFLPSNGENEKKPTILIYTPYTGSLVVPEMSLFDRIGSKYYIGKWGPDYERMSLKKLNTLTSNGYIVALADMRGTGSSTGFSGTLDPLYISDAKEILEWIAGQSWSNAKIGMMGQSYMGWSQFAAASTQSPYLKCIAPEMIFYNLYEEAIRPGGIYAQKWNTDYSLGTLELNNRNLWNTDADISSYPSEPVIDEDGDGKTYDDIPIMKNNDRSLITVNPKYADGNLRENSSYIKLTKEHEKNIWPKDISKKYLYLDDTAVYFDRNVTYSNSSIDILIKKIKETKIPVLLTGGFFDGFSAGIPKSYTNLHQTNPTYLFMAPRFHIPVNIPGEYSALFDYKHSYQDQFLSTQLQFFDKYLKDMNNGFESNKHVKIYTAFEGWKYYDSWPPAEAKSVQFSFGLNNVLTNEIQRDSVYAYDVDFTHSSAYNSNKTNPQLMIKFNDSVMVRTKQDKKCLVFETEKLTNSLTLTGHPIINLEISSNQPNADVYVYLSDVDKNGKSYYVSEGKLRAGWHQLLDNNESVNNLYDVKPELPWHSYKKENYDPAPFANDSIVNLRFELKPQAWKFKKGHKIRISIAGADNENYEFNPTISPDNTLENCKPTTLYIHTGEIKNSYLEVPVIK